MAMDYSVNPATARLTLRRRRLERDRLGQLRRPVLAGVDEAVGLELVLFIVHLAVTSITSEQLVVLSPLDDLAVLHDQDLIGAADRRQAVRDHERGAAAAELLQAVLDHLLALAVEAPSRPAPAPPPPPTPARAPAP